MVTDNSFRIEIFSITLDIVNTMLQLLCSADKYANLRKLSAICTRGVKGLRLTKCFREFCVLVISEKIFRL